MSTGAAQATANSRAVLHEREAELERVDALLERVQTANRGTVIVEGEPGAGKTTLLDAAAERARERGIAPLATRGFELRHPGPYPTA